MMVRFIVLQCSLIPLIIQAQFLFNISNDPNERVNLFGLEEYASVQLQIDERLSYHKQFEREPLGQVNYAAGVWSKAGAAVPWLNYDSPPEITELRVEKTNKTAPHIVFILLDDVGWSDIGYSAGGSHWAGESTPQINELAASGIKLGNHYTSWVCGPSRASLLTGRYANRLGFQSAPGGIPILPLDEVTVAQELHRFGYQTAMVGKWHLGFEKWEHTPLFRGFDTFYGYYGGSVGYYSKKNQAGFLDLFDQTEPVTSASELTGHLTTVLQYKVEEAIERHVVDHQDSPLFLYYAMQNVHTGLMGGDEVFEAPSSYLDLCQVVDEGESSGYEQHICALLIMMDEAVGRTACKVQELLNDRDYLIVLASDNGGWGQISGANYPHRGSKGSIVQGGIQNPAFMFGSLIPTGARGSTFDGLVHLSDWMPTFLSLASGGEWSIPQNNYEIDGFDVFEGAIRGGVHPRTEIFHNRDADGGSMQIGTMKYVNGTLGGPTQPEAFFVVTEAGMPQEVCEFEGGTDLTSAPAIVPAPALITPLPVTTPPTLNNAAPAPTPAAEAPRPCSLFDVIFGLCLDE